MLLASAATAAAVALAGCNSETLTRSSLRANQPISPQLTAEIAQKNMTQNSPILLRIFKEEAELEVWKQARDGRYALLKTYPICRWSGELGPKIREGDRQAPEGFYSITPAQMNPHSSYYLAFNTGYPNAYDRSLGHTGSDLMIHGDCSSRGCYAMTDEQIGEIYALARDAFFGGQKEIQLQAYPFRMTPVNMARHRGNPNVAFWKMLKRGYDHFAVSHLEPKVNVCEKHYVFDAQAPAGSSTPLSFSASGKCPAYQVSPDLLAAVAEKESRDDTQVAELISSGTPAAPIKTGTDGGMNPVFLAALEAREGKTDANGRFATTLAAEPAPGTIPATAVPPRSPHPVYAKGSTGGGSYALAGESTSLPGSSVLRRLMGFGAAQQTAETEQPLVGTPSKRATAETRHDRAPKRQVADAPASVLAAKQAAVAKEAAAPRQGASHPSALPPHPVAVAKAQAVAKQQAAGKARPALRGTADAESADLVADAKAVDHKPAPHRQPTATAMAAPTDTIIGSQRVLPAGTFQSRWTAFR
jgi:murein L,D-transpeptidase YafK